MASLVFGTKRDVKLHRSANSISAERLSYHGVSAFGFCPLALMDMRCEIHPLIQSSIVPVHDSPIAHKFLDDESRACNGGESLRTGADSTCE